LKIIPEFYKNEGIDLYISLHEGIDLNLRVDQIFFFKNFPKNQRGVLLDIGCGNGSFLKAAKEAGFEVWGTDLDSKSVEIAKKIVGEETVLCMDFETFYNFAKKKNLKFNIITFFEVLEHQDNPRKFLEMVKDLLSEGGWIAGSVPDKERLFVDVDWKYFHTDYPPHHFLRFSPTVLQRILEIMGFKTSLILKPKFPFRELPYFLEKKYFGNLEKLKTKLKKSVGVPERIAKGMAIEKLKLYGGKNWKIFFLKVAKIIRNVLFSPLVIFYLNKLKNGPFLYFQAEKQ
jgi:SAM-dependent methyltransferase